MISIGVLGDSVGWRLVHYVDCYFVRHKELRVLDSITSSIIVERV